MILVLVLVSFWYFTECVVFMVRYVLRVLYLVEESDFHSPKEFHENECCKNHIQRYTRSIVKVQEFWKVD